jgi:hypothetical protein
MSLKMGDQLHERLKCALALVFIGVPAAGWCTPGEVLLKELREQIDAQRQAGTMDELAVRIDSAWKTPSDYVECTPQAIAEFRHSNKNGADSHGNYIYNATYSYLTIPVGTKRCVYLTRPMARALTLGEARDLSIAGHLEYPR